MLHLGFGSVLFCIVKPQPSTITKSYQAMKVISFQYHICFFIYMNFHICFHLCNYLIFNCSAYFRKLGGKSEYPNYLIFSIVHFFVCLLCILFEIAKNICLNIRSMF